jgi:hypothetical protein
MEHAGYRPLLCLCCLLPFPKKNTMTHPKFFICTLRGTMACTQPCFIVNKALGEISERILQAHYIRECPSLTSRDLRLVTFTFMITFALCFTVAWTHSLGTFSKHGPRQGPLFTECPHALHAV